MRRYNRNEVSGAGFLAATHKKWAGRNLGLSVPWWPDKAPGSAFCQPKSGETGWNPVNPAYACRKAPFIRDGIFVAANK
jgi:hypothetical protein